MPQSPSDREYWAFISYRHADNNDEGRQWATWLHQVIETYEVPADLVGTENSRGETIPERIFPIFRDEEELAADHDLAGPIYRALDNSRYLVAICSPRAVLSQYVANEIAYFKREKSDRVVAMMIDGEPGAENNAKLRSAGIEDCFPLPLRFKIDAEGAMTEEGEEPIAADFRLVDDKGLPQQGWTSPEALRQDLSRRRVPSKKAERLVEDYTKQLDLMKMKVIAGVLGVPLGTLTKRDKAYQLVLAQKRARVLRRWMSALAVLTILAIGAGVVAWFMKQESDRNAETAQRNEETAKQNYSNNLAENGLGFLAEARVPEGLAALDASLREWPDNPVARQRFLYEILYRRWSVASAVYPPPPLLTFIDPEGNEQAGTEFRVISTREDGTIVLEHEGRYSTKDYKEARVTRRATLRPEQGSWELGEPRTVVVEEEEDVPGGNPTATQLRNGIVLIPAEEDEGRAGDVYSSFEARRNGVAVPFTVRNGNEVESVVPHGYLAVHDAGQHLAFASNGYIEKENRDSDEKSMVITVFDAASLERIHQYALSTDGQTELDDVEWRGSHLVVNSMTEGWDMERVDVFEVDPGNPQSMRILIEDFGIKDQQWACHGGALYVQSLGDSLLVPSLVAYRPMESAMTSWSADEYRGQEVGRFASQEWRREGLAQSGEESSRGAHSVRSPDQGMIAYEDGGSIQLETSKGTRINVIRPEISVAWRDLSILAFSRSGESLLLIGKMAPIEGDQVEWELFDVDTGMQTFPIISLGYFPPDPQPSDPEGLGGYYEPFAWTADGRALVFGKGDGPGDPPKAVPTAGVAKRLGENGIGTNSKFSVLGRNHVTEIDGNDCLIHPIVLAETPCPSWFLDLARQLYRVQREGVTAVAPVSAPARPFHGMARSAAAENPEAEYVRLALLLAEASK